MAKPSDHISVTILGKEYNVACKPDELDDLRRAARELDQRMRAIKTGGSVIGLERIAVMTALNLCHELLQHKDGPAQAPVDSAALQRLAAKIDQALQH